MLNVLKNELIAQLFSTVNTSIRQINKKLNN